MCCSVATDYLLYLQAWSACMQEDEGRPRQPSAWGSLQRWSLPVRYVCPAAVVWYVRNELKYIAALTENRSGVVLIGRNRYANCLIL